MEAGEAEKHACQFSLCVCGARGEELTLGGVGDGQAAIGKILGPGLSADDAVTAVIACVRVYADHAQAQESFIQTLNRLGTDPFKEAVYGA